MGTEWLDQPRSPMDTGGDSGSSGGGNKKGVAFGVLAFMALPAGLVLGLGLYFAHGYGLI